MRKTIMSLLDFSKKERTGIYLLLFVSTCVWIIPLFFSKDEINLTSLKITILEMESKKRILIDRRDSVLKSFDKSPYKNKYLSKDEAISSNLFYFNPNEIGEKEWLKLGLNKKNVTIIFNYISKGGMFRKKEDLKKIYGVSEMVIEKIMPYAVFNTNQLDTNKKEFNVIKSIPINKINLNEADSTALVELPGIGEKLSIRIIKYRDRLGGFYSTEQLSEVYGISDSAIAMVKKHVYISDAISVKKIVINTVDYKELTKHPYITFVMAKLILAYRKSHGNFIGVDDLRMVEGIDLGKMEKLIPYLIF